MVGAYNRLVRLRGAIGAAFAQLDAQLERRARELPLLLGALREPLPAERATFDAVDTAQAAVQAAAQSLRGAPVRRDAAAVLSTAVAQLDSALTRLLSLLDQHAELRGLPVVAASLRELHDADLRFAFARQLYNDAVAAYNEAARQFPTRILTRVYGFGPAGRL